MQKLNIIVPAKGNSKRVPKKNLKILGGFPLIHWTLDPLIKSKIGKIIVSSESEEILEYASGYDVILHKRPKELSLPNVHSSLAVFDAAQNYCDNEDYVGIAIPTLPFRKPETLIDLKNNFLLNDLRSLISIASLRVTRNHILFKSGNIYKRLSEQYNFQDDDSPESFAFSGYLQLASWKEFKIKKSFHLLNPIFHEVPFQENLDINTIEDFDFAKFFINNLSK